MFIRLLSFAGLSLVACGALRLAIPVDRSMLHPVSNAEGKCGYVDSRGKLAIPFGIWDYADDFRGDFALVGTGWEFVCIDRRGEIVAATEGNPWRLFPSMSGDGLIRAQDTSEEGLKKIGIVNVEGKIVVPFEWDDIRDFDEFGMALVKRGEKAGYIDKEAKILIPVEWDEIIQIGDGTFLEARKGSRWTTLNRKGEIQEPEIINGLVRTEEGGKFGVSRWNGEVLIRPMWKSLTLLSHGEHSYAVVSKDYYKGIIDMNGDVILPLEWQELRTLGSDGLGFVAAMKGIKWGMINLWGEEVIPFEWDNLGPFDQTGMAFAKKGKLWGAIDREGNTVIPIEWENTLTFNELGFAPAQRKGKWGLIDREGKEVSPFVWDSMNTFGKLGWVRVRKGSLIGMIRADGEIMIPPIWKPGVLGDSGINEMNRPHGYEGYRIFLMTHRDPSFVSDLKQKWSSFVSQGIQLGSGLAFEHCEVRTGEGRLIWSSDHFSYAAKSWWILAFGAGVFLLSHRKRLRGWTVDRRRNVGEVLP